MHVDILIYTYTHACMHVYKSPTSPQRGRVVAMDNDRAMPSGTSIPGRATPGGLVWHLAVLGLQPA